MKFTRIMWRETYTCIYIYIYIYAITVIYLITKRNTFIFLSKLSSDTVIEKNGSGGQGGKFLAWKQTIHCPV